jgi:two-component system, NtrC family, sensor kinase
MPRPVRGVFQFDGDLVHLLAQHGLSPEGVDVYARSFPRAPARDTAIGRALLDRAIVHIQDVQNDPEYGLTTLAMTGTMRCVVTVPVLREGHPIGGIVAWRSKPEPFPDRQIELLRTFANQTLIAIENVRLFRELETRNRDLSETLEQQTATGEILRVISSSPTDVQPVFDTIAQSAMRLCGAGYSVIGRYDGELLHLVAHAHVRAEGVETLQQAFPMRPSRATTTSRAILDRTVVHVPDVLKDLDYARPVALALQNRSTLAVPMLREGEPIGTISVGRFEPLPFTDKQIDLLKTFADQAVIAIENVRLFKELEAKNRDLTETLEQQTATGDILRVISGSPTDVQPVFDTIAENARRLCDAEFCAVLRFDGALLHFVAHHGVTAEGVEAWRRHFPVAPDRGSGAGRAILGAAVDRFRTSTPTQTTGLASWLGSSPSAASWRSRSCATAARSEPSR